MARAKLIELFKRKDDFVKSEDVHINGYDNDYPERMRRVISNSKTAKSCANKLIDFLYGYGFESNGETTVNKIKGLTLDNLLAMACEDVAYNYGFWLHINYDAEGKVNYLDVLPYEKCRKSKNDSFGYGGLIYYNESWGKDTSSFSFSKKKNKAKYFYPYNPDIKVINEQRKKDTKSDNIKEVIEGYRGQVLFVSPDLRSTYPLSLFDAVYNDCDTEYRISDFRNNKVRNGFIEATIVMMREQSEDEEIISDEAIRGLIGSENQSGVLKVVANIDNGQKLEEAIAIKTIKSDVDQGMFKDWELSIEDGIINSCKQIPKILVKSSDGALFGASAEAMQKAQDFYNQQTSREREVITKAFEKVLGFELKIKELGKSNNTTTGVSPTI